MVIPYTDGLSSATVGMPISLLQV